MEVSQATTKTVSLKLKTKRKRLYKLDSNKIVIYESSLSFGHCYKCELIWSI